MDAFKIENNLYFKNYDRIKESIILEKVLKKLKQDSSFVLYENIMGPSEDIKRCTIKGCEFYIVYDIDYGVSIYSKDKTIIDMLQDYFNN